MSRLTALQLCLYVTMGRRTCSSLSACRLILRVGLGYDTAVVFICAACDFRVVHFQRQRVLS